MKKTKNKGVVGRGGEIKGKINNKFTVSDIHYAISKIMERDASVIANKVLTQVMSMIFFPQLLSKQEVKEIKKRLL